MPTKLAARVARDLRQQRLGNQGLKPSPAYVKIIDDALAAGATFRRVDRNYVLGSTSFVMVRGVAYTELGRYALDRVTAMGLDQSKFQLLAQEVTINIPTIRAKEEVRRLEATLSFVCNEKSRNVKRRL